VEGTRSHYNPGPCVLELDCASRAPSGLERNGIGIHRESKMNEPAMSQTSGKTLNAVRWIMAFLAVGAVCLQAWHLTQIERFVLDQYLSFFTIQSNLLAAFVLACEAAGGLGLSHRRRDSLRGALVLYLGITGVVYACLLARLPIVKAIVHPWADLVLHYGMPLWIMIDWLIAPPGSKISFRRALKWLIYPIAYLFLTLLRGAWTDWYPYPFLDPKNPGGWPAIAIVSAVITLLAVLAIWVILYLGQLRNRFVSKLPAIDHARDPA
jgi:hypothetical protein